MNGTYPDDLTFCFFRSEIRSRNLASLLRATRHFILRVKIATPPFPDHVRQFERLPTGLCLGGWRTITTWVRVTGQGSSGNKGYCITGNDVQNDLHICNLGFRALDTPLPYRSSIILSNSWLSATGRGFVFLVISGLGFLRIPF